MLFRKKVEARVKSQQKSKQERQDIWSAQEFVKGLSRGKTLIGSLLFSGDEREQKIVRQICSYLNYNLVGKREILCSFMDCKNKAYITHYEVT
jgi:hypothetical protein